MAEKGVFPVAYFPCLADFVPSMSCLAMRIMCFLIAFFTFPALCKAKDSLIIAQSFVNLSLSLRYYDSLSTNRVVKVTNYIEANLATVTDKKFVADNKSLLGICFSILYVLKAKVFLNTHAKASRSVLLAERARLDSCIDYFNSISFQPGELDFEKNPFFEFINLDSDILERTRSEILTIKDRMSVLFNLNIYPDFKRIFYVYKHEKKIQLDSLISIASIFNMPVTFSVLENQKQLAGNDTLISTQYKLARENDLISQFLQFKHIVYSNKIVDTPTVCIHYLAFGTQLKPEDGDLFGQKIEDNLVSILKKKDVFFKKEMNLYEYKLLGRQLFPKGVKLPKPVLPDSDGDGVTDAYERSKKMYFPEPAPFPSCNTSVLHYRPALRTMKAVDAYLRKVLDRAGYLGRYRYYYVKSGFALTTMLERISEKGMPERKRRWDITSAPLEKFTLYNIFKAIFFTQDGNFRFFALTIAPKEFQIGNTVPMLPEIELLLKNSYASLPADLENFTLTDKALTVLVYHFYQNDIGEQPELDVTGRLSAIDHLRAALLDELIKL